MRLLTAGSLVRAQQGEPNKSTSNDVLFSFACAGLRPFPRRWAGRGEGAQKGPAGAAASQNAGQNAGQMRGGTNCARPEKACPGKAPARKSPASKKPRPEKAPLRKSPPRKSLPRKTRPGKAPARKSPATAKSSAPAKRPERCPYAVKNQSSRLPNSLRRRSGLCSSAQVMAQGEVNSSSLLPFRSSMRRVSLVRSRFLGSRSSFSIQRMCS